MEYKVSDIVAQARLYLDENASGERLMQLGDADTVTLEGLIKQYLIPSARTVLLVAPAKLLVGVALLTEETGTNGTKVQTAVSGKSFDGGIIKDLPTDFLRLLTFKMKSWKMAVTSAITESSPLYSRQKSEYGVRGSKEFPVVALVHGGNGLQLEYYGGAADDTVDYATYIKSPEITNDGNLDLPTRGGAEIRDAVAMLAASDTALSMLEADRGKTLRELAYEQLGAINTGGAEK